jgi:photosystem II stability/assembly factor-like uncharacterized protein
MVLIGALIAGCGGRSASVLSEPSPKASSSATDARADPLIREFETFVDGSGWVLSQRGVFRTTDSGGRWKRIENDELAVRSYVRDSLAAFFLDADHAWVVRAGLATPSIVTVWRTADGGGHWSSGTVTIEDISDPGGGLRLFFADRDNGWLLAGHPTSTASSVDSLYATKDGGRTWSERTAPIADGFVFIDADHGWMAGGPGGERLYSTDDGGATWSKREPPTADMRGYASLAVPEFTSERDGVLAVQLAEDAVDAQSELRFFVTHDGGTSWEETKGAIRTACCGVIFHGDLSRLAVIDPDTWFLAIDRQLLTRDAGATWHEVETTADLPPFLRVRFVDRERAWAYLENGDCESVEDAGPDRKPKVSGCSYRAELHGTVDGGVTWREITPSEER